MFNWEPFCQDYSIDYTPQNSRGYTHIVCPYCLSNKKHGGLHSEGFYTCFICGAHSIYEVVKILTGENWYLLQTRYKTELSPRDIFLLENSEREERKSKIIFPERLIPVTARAHKYLQGRGFDSYFLEKKYKLQSTTELGNLCHRLYIPIIFENVVVSWTTRDITNKAPQRYMSCPERDEVTPHKTIVYNADNINGNKAVLVEGVTDCWKLGDNSICCFGIKYTQAQVNYLATLEKLFVVFDDEPNAQAQADSLGNILSGLGTEVEIIKLGTGDDPGNLSQKDADDLMKQLMS